MSSRLTDPDVAGLLGRIAPSCVAARWDLNAVQRSADIDSGSDVTYFAILEAVQEIVLDQIPWARRGVALDIGCGLGYSTDRLRSIGFDPVGIDCSGVSVAKASATFEQSTFVHMDAASAGGLPLQELALVTYVMSAHCIASFRESLADIARGARVGTRFVLALPSPDSFLLQRKFGLTGRELAQARAFEVTFAVNGLRRHPSKVIHFHRPLQDYLGAIAGAGLELELFEPAGEKGTKLSDVVIVSAVRV